MVRNQSYLREEKIIRVARCGDRNFLQLPFGCGYEMEVKDLSEEDFSLAVLSQDMDYDLYMLQTRQGVSEHIRDQGAFYPLDEIEPVKELLSACLPYIQEAAINKDNMIWMVPFYVQTNTFVYREGLEEFGLDFYTGMSLEEFFRNYKFFIYKKRSA